MIYNFYYTKMSEFYINKPYVCYYDLETTGLNWYHERIIEVAADIDGHTFSQLCHNEGKPLPDIITKITGISEEDLVGAKSESRVLKDFCHFIKQRNGPIYLVAHNNESFDKWFLKTRSHANKIRISSNYRYVDSLLLAKLIYPNRDRYSLNSLCNDLGVKQIQAHRAADDVRCLKEVFIKMTQHFNIRYGLSGDVDDSIETIWKKTQCL